MRPIEPKLIGETNLIVGMKVLAEKYHATFVKGSNP